MSIVLVAIFAVLFFAVVEPLYKVFEKRFELLFSLFVVQDTVLVKLYLVAVPALEEFVGVRIPVV